MTINCPCRANLHQWGLARSPSCDCGQRPTMNHIVDTCPLTKFEGRLNLLYEADDDAVIWLESTATAALVKKINNSFIHCHCSFLLLLAIFHFPWLCATSRLQWIQIIIMIICVNLYAVSGYYKQQRCWHGGWQADTQTDAVTLLSL